MGVSEQDFPVFTNQSVGVTPHHPVLIQQMNHLVFVDTFIKPNEAERS